MRISWVAFLTMGFGNGDEPNGIKNWLIVEGVIGLFLMAYFTISVSRRTSR
jgi:hypothetical protein